MTPKTPLWIVHIIFGLSITGGLLVSYSMEKSSPALRLKDEKVLQNISKGD